jgi:hypothetical protein
MKDTDTQHHKEEIRVHLHEEQCFPDINEQTAPAHKRRPWGAVAAGVVAVLCFGGGIAVSNFDFNAMARKEVTVSDSANVIAVDAEGAALLAAAKNNFYAHYREVDRQGLEAVVPDAWQHVVRLSEDAKAAMDNPSAVLLWKKAAEALVSAEQSYEQQQSSEDLAVDAESEMLADLPVEPDLGEASSVLAAKMDDLTQSFSTGLNYDGFVVATRQHISTFVGLMDHSLAEEDAVKNASQRFWKGLVSHTLTAVAQGEDDLLPIARGQLASALPYLYGSAGYDGSDLAAVFPSFSGFFPFKKAKFFKGLPSLPDNEADSFLKNVLEGLPPTHAAHLFPAGGELMLVSGQSGRERSEQIPLILVPGGEINAPGDIPRVKSPFYMATCETTRQAMRCYSDAVRGLTEGDAFRFKRISGHGPYAQATVGEAIRFCNWLSRRDGLSELYISTGEGAWDVNLRLEGYRLPFDDEWEYAARFGFDFAVSDGRSSWNAMRSEVEGVNGLVWFYDKKLAGPRTADPAHAYPLGFHDLCGNVEELCMEASSMALDRTECVSVGFVSMGGSIASRSVEQVMPWSTEKVRENEQAYGFRVVRALPVEIF